MTYMPVHSTSPRPIQTDLRKSAPVGAADPLAGLEHEHSLAMDHIRCLEDAARAIRERGFTAASFETIAAKAVLLEEIFRKHDLIEEQHIYPVIEKFGPEYVKDFREDHRTMRSLFATLGALVRDLEHGRIHGSSVGDLLRTTQELVLVLRRHILGENDLIFPLLRQRLGPDEVESLKAGIRDAAFPGSPRADAAGDS